MSKLGRWMCPHEIVEQAMFARKQAVSDLSIAEEARLEEFVLQVCAVPDGGELRLFVCEGCGRIGTAERSDKRACSATCRKKVSRHCDTPVPEVPLYIMAEIGKSLGVKVVTA